MQISLKADERDVYDFFSRAGKVRPDLCHTFGARSPFVREELLNLKTLSSVVREEDNGSHYQRS